MRPVRLIPIYRELWIMFHTKYSNLSVVSDVLLVEPIRLYGI